MTLTIRKNIIPWWEFLLLCFFSAYYLTPFHMNLSIVPFMGLVLVYVFYVYIHDKKIRSHILVYVSLIFLLSLLYCVLTDTKTIQSESFYILKRILSKVQQYTWMFLPVLLSYTFLGRANKKQYLIMGLLMLFIIIFIMIETLIAISMYPDITRSFDMEMIDSDIVKYVGNYYFVFLMPFLVIVFTIFPYEFKKSYVLLSSFAFLIFIFYFLLKSQFTLALLISVAGLFLIIGTRIHSVPNIVIYTILMALFLLYLLPAIEFLMNNVESEQMAERLKDISEFLSYGEKDTYNLGGRLNLYKESVDAFAASPLWGNRSLPFDGHATLLTILADLGLLGGIPFYFLLFYSLHNEKKFLKENRTISVAFILLLLMGFTNPIHSSSQISFGIWFIIPFCIQYINKIKNYR